MGPRRFYLETIQQGRVTLPGAETAHALRVLRLSVGDPVVTFDGRGTEASGRIVAAGRGGVEIDLAPPTRHERHKPALTLAVALPKGPRQDLLIEKCTELGVAAVVPLLTERSVSAASEHKLGRWRRTAMEAAKQSGQCWLPEFAAPEPLSIALQRIPASGPAVGNRGSSGDEALQSPERKRGAELPEGPPQVTPLACAQGSEGPLLSQTLAIVAAPEKGKSLISLLSPTIESIVAFIGPEGGWTDDELRALMEAGCQPASLGPNILRIETAAMAIAAAVHLVQERS
ncbi:MAG: ribosomal RNA small subunit methyltransferase E [Phycisphaerae bacterium]